MTCLSKPVTEELGTFLTQLFGLDVEVQEAPADACTEVHSAGGYQDGQGELKSVIGCDIASAAKLAAALTQIPPGGVEEAIQAGSLSENLVDNLREVYNILVNVFPEAHAHRLASKDVLIGAGAADSFTSSTTGFELECYQIDIARYGQGTICVATCV